MKNSEIERWALRVIQHVVEGKPNEDSRVELKREWPQDHAKAARQIAGHANAARRENILWLIGVDEEAGAVGAQDEEKAEWLPKIQSQFDGLAPRCFDLNVPFNDQVIVALLFQTDRAPFVVRNPLFGKEKGAVIQFEVPWREGASTRSANRSDLLLLLSDIQPLRGVLGELEWNSAVANQESSRPFANLHTKEFHKAKKTDAFLVLETELREKIFNAYLEISNVQDYINKEKDLSSQARQHLNQTLREPIEKAKNELYHYLGIPRPVNRKIIHEQ